MATTGTPYKVLALIVDYESHEEASDLARRLAQVPTPGFSLAILHIDNCSPTPAQADLYSASTLKDKVRLLRLPRNDGYAGGVHEALIRMDPQGQEGPPAYDAYWILNSDLSVDPECLSKLVDVLFSNPRTAAVGPRVMRGSSARVWGARGVVSPVTGTTAMTDWKSDEPLPRWSYIPGCSLLTRAREYWQMGGLPRRYRLYYEETEYCVQLQKNGFELRVVPAAIVRHHVASMKAGVPARHFAFYFARNNLYFWQRNFGIPWVVQLPRTMFVLTKELLLPLRRAKSPAEAWDRAKYIALGLVDGFEFLKVQFTRNEKRLFLGKSP